MKNIYKFLLMTIIASGTMFYSCETLELEDLASPNSLSDDLADPDLLLNSIQLAYRANMIDFNDNSAQLSRIDYFFGRNYFEALNANTLNGIWTRFYSNDGTGGTDNRLRGIVVNLSAIEALNDANPDIDLSYHIGMSKIMQAHNLMLLVDFLGDVPWSEANNPTEYPSPNVDNSQDVYNAAIALLDEAKALLNGASLGTATDFFYNGDADKWIKLANTLKMRADLTVGNYSAVLSASNLIEDTADDIEFKYGTNVLSPDTRHPDYNQDYRSDGANIYQSHWLMQLMTGDPEEWYDQEGVWEIGDDIVNQTESDDLPMTDPRRRYYFYRQAWYTPGNFAMLYHSAAGTGAWPEFFGTTSENGETLQCSIQDTPLHYQFTPDEGTWCSLPLGYWGRPHGNDEGIPPDNFSRTAVGVYPAGGSFDNQFDIPFYPGGSGVQNLPHGVVGLGGGGGGAGIEPIFLASYVHFMKAEAELKLGNTGAAASLMEAGMATSIAKVMSFGSLDSDANSALIPTAEEVTDFIADIVDQFNDAPMTSGLQGNGFPVEKDKMDILGEQYFVALYGGSADAYNFVRRTGYPRTLQRSIEPDPGTFPRTFLYPSNEISTNPNIQQRTDLNAKAFWDQGVTNPAN